MVRQKCSGIRRSYLGCFTSPLLVTEYKMVQSHSSSLYRKAINNSLKQINSYAPEHSDDLLYM
ncbi:hypothetical protein DL189_23690 [Enterobacter hormaechei]|uniref:Uncharacterized protein n=1 Tax=Enterobacter hormaechei TaxID=158836 RepID=A0A9X7KXP6_9ENTR|nr:hypothetical protein DL189_23690 [Enterobacter hormaechei]